MFRAAWSRLMKAKANPAKPRRVPERKLRPELEALETRLLLSFAPPVGYRVGTQPSLFNGSTSADAVAVGDFNGDGKADLAVVHTVDNTLNILLNRGNGTFLPAVSYPTRGLAPLDIVVADFNRDGKPDIAVTNPGNWSNNFASTISVFLNNGDGTFRPAVTYAAGILSRGFTVGDFWGDGKLDLATTNFFDHTVSILRGNGDGTFQRRITLAVPSWPRALVAGDFDGNGGAADDLAVVHGTDPSDGLSIFMGNGNGTFQAPREYATPPTPGGGAPYPENVIVGDLRNTGKTDLIVSCYDHSIDVFLGNGNGTFQPAAAYDTGNYPRAVAIADVNGDGKKDLVVANIGNRNEGAAGSVAVLLGNGNGTFQSAVQYTPFEYPGWVAVGDFNRDGWPDIAVTRVEDGHSVNVMMNRGLRAAVSAGNLANANPVAVTPPTLPAPVSKVQATQVTTNAVNLSWQNNANNATSIEVFRQAGAGNFILIATLPPTATSLRDTGLVAALTPHTPYTYRVQAVNVAGPSPVASISITTAQASANLLAVIDAGGPATSPLVTDTDFGGSSKSIFPANTNKLRPAPRPTPPARSPARS